MNHTNDNIVTDNFSTSSFENQFSSTLLQQNNSSSKMIVLNPENNKSKGKHFISKLEFKVRNSVTNDTKHYEIINPKMFSKEFEVLLEKTKRKNEIALKKGKGRNEKPISQSSAYLPKYKTNQVQIIEHFKK